VDECALVSLFLKEVKLDFIIKAAGNLLENGVEGYRKIGIIARDKLTTDSPRANSIWNCHYSYQTPLVLVCYLLMIPALISCSN
jgi:hypothetical protein